MSIAADIKRMRCQFEREVAKRRRCRWGGCGGPSTFEFRLRLARPHDRSYSEFYCDDCAYLARQSYCSDLEGRWPTPPVPQTAISLPIGPGYSWIERIEAVRIAPYPVGSEQWIAIECALSALAGKD